MNRSPANTIASCVALSAFTVAIVAGMSSDNPASAVLGRALIAMIICYPLGLLAGLLSAHVIDQHIAARRSEANAVPDAAENAAQADEPASGGAEDDEEVLVV